MKVCSALLELRVGTEVVEAVELCDPVVLRGVVASPVVMPGNAWMFITIPPLAAVLSWLLSALTYEYQVVTPEPFHRKEPALVSDLLLVHLPNSQRTVVARLAGSVDQKPWKGCRCGAEP
jgi:hypothetical protein